MRITPMMRAAMAMTLVAGVGYLSGSRRSPAPENEPETVEIKPPPIDVGMKPARVVSASDLSAIEAAKNKRARKQMKRKGGE